METLEVILHQSKKKISVYDYLRYRSVYEFFVNWKERDMTRKNAALNAAKKVYDKGLYRARIINKWAKSWIKHGVLPISLQGCHQKTKSFIDDEDVIEKSLEFIRENEGKKLHIFVTHDECLFYANDDRPIIWTPLGEPPLRKKGQGKSIMVSDFLIETIGCLKLTDEQAQIHPEISQEA